MIFIIGAIIGAIALVVLSFIERDKIPDYIVSAVMGALIGFLIALLLAIAISAFANKAIVPEPAETIYLSEIAEDKYTLVSDGYLYYIQDKNDKLERISLTSIVIHKTDTKPKIEKYYYQPTNPIVDFLVGYIDTEYHIYLPKGEP